MNCNDAGTLVTAYVDGEADTLQRHLVKRHLVACPNCAARHGSLLSLRAEIRAGVPRFPAPPALRARVLAALDAARAPARVAARPRALAGGWRWLTGGTLAGCAATMLTWFLGTAALEWRVSEDLAAEAVTSHVRATLSNHLIQVVSSDQHTVKPWLSARLDYSPPVRDMAQEGFALAGGRVDYLDRHPVATLVYRFGDHTIDVYVRPAPLRTPPAMSRSVRGFTVTNATGARMEWLAVSDVDADVLTSFVQRLAREAGTP